MSEIRKHYFLDEYCIIASERGRRPSDFKSGTKKIRPTNCQFCGGNEDKTPPATAVYKNDLILQDTDGNRVTGWQVRCFPNLYPAVSPETDKLTEKTENSIVFEGYGFHEIIVETPVHDKTLPDFTDQEMAFLMCAYRDRFLHYNSQKKIAYVSLFKNSGEVAGASLDHTHTQLIALPLNPPKLVKELEAIASSSSCPYCTILKNELNTRRIIAKNDHCIAFAPFFSQYEFEVWIIPYTHVSHLGECSEDELRSLGYMLKKILAKLRFMLDDPPYNFMFFQETGQYHLNVRIQPVLSKIAGFEKNTDIFINTVAPEQAADFLKIDTD